MTSDAGAMMKWWIASMLACLVVSIGPVALAQINYDSGDETVFAHPQDVPWWLSGQGNFIFQWHPPFHAAYSGPHSFEHASEQAASEVATLYTGLQLGPYTEALVDVESAGGSGLSQVLGLAGFTNVDAVRNPSLSAVPYLARALFHQVIPLSDEYFAAERGPLSLLTSIPVRRLDVSVGKFDLVDYFDVNSVGGDSHMQFMNWTVVNNGAFDYAADTRGYTWGGVIDYEDRYWAFRFAEALLSKRANGLTLQKNLQRAHSENFELELRPELIQGRNTALRLLAFTNYADMGDYRVAIDNFLEGKTATPEIDDHPEHTTLKYGFGINGEQEFTSYIRGFFRAGWNEGQHESWNYTEVNQSATVGGDVRGTLWARPQDKLGLAFAINGISQSHREYLGLGGLGFVLGDGRLNYAPEKIVESYYNFPIQIYHGVYGAVDLQYIDDPGYNRDRGPVIVPSLRLHVEL